MKTATRRGLAVASSLLIAASAWVIAHRRRMVELSALQSEAEIRRHNRCTEESAECFDLVTVTRFLETARARKRLPPWGDPECGLFRHVDGINIEDIGPTMERLDRDEGFFRSPSVARYRLIPSGKVVAQCCLTLKACDSSQERCGCSFDCNTENAGR